MEKLEAIAAEIRDEDYPRKSPAKKLWFFWSRNAAEDKVSHGAKYYVPIRWNPKYPRVMFIAPNPSTGKFEPGNENDKLVRFLKTLSDHNFAEKKDEIDKDTRTCYEGCFVTDIIKVRLQDEEAAHDLQEFEDSGNEHALYWESKLAMEIRTVNPLLIVALGDHVFRILTQMSTRETVLDRPIEKAFHYGSFRFPKRKEEFDKQIARLKRVYDFLESAMPKNTNQE